MDLQAVGQHGQHALGARGTDPRNGQTERRAGEEYFAVHLPYRTRILLAHYWMTALDYAAEYQHGSAWVRFELRVAGEKATLTSYRVESEAFNTQKTPK